MRNEHKHRSARQMWVVFAVGLIWSFGVGTGLAGVRDFPVPLVTPAGNSPWTTSQQSMQYRRLEAEAKARWGGGPAGLQAVQATPNMGLYDVEFYDLDLDFDPQTTLLTGTATIRAVVTGGPLSTMDLNLNLNMYVPGTRSGGVATGYSRVGEILTVALDRGYLTGETVTVEVDYYGNPAGDYFGWDQYGGQPLIWTLSEPYGARQWWPCKDLNTDKADSVALHVTVPTALVVASNGTLDQVTVPAVGKKTYHWTERYPIATYLVSVTAHPYAVFTNTYVSAQGDSMPLEYYVVPDHLSIARDGYRPVAQMIGALASVYGPYPFIQEKYGHVHFPWGGGMEHQTCTSLHFSGYSQGLISHELSHQWFGDLITCADFTDIWINEGFATWSEAVWLEHSVGLAAYHTEMNLARYLGPGTITVETPDNFYSIFNFSLSYQKASWVPHMLRHALGEADFQAGLTALLTDHAFGGVTTADVQAAFEAASGQDLNAFFQQWIYGEYYPAYSLAWQAVPEGAQTRVMVKVTQTQTNTGLFAMPLDLRVTTAWGDTTFVLQNNLSEQWYDVVVDGAVTGVQLDPDGWVLCTVSSDGVSDVPAPVASLTLYNNVPNPFNPATDLRFHLASETDVRLDIHDVAGRLVKHLVDGSYGAGDHRVRWDGTDNASRAVASGTYFARLRGGTEQQVRPLTLVR